ncbi:MAG: DNA primase, partial [Candidatus Thermoplasmatota archaeon]|nr:DNA primase [Candidatus Thermoplasmatota archaeon]
MFDEDTYKLARKERLKIAQMLSKKYAINEWVTAGEMRLVRLPYSLHGMVSRICIPVKITELKYFGPRTSKECLPKFL